MVGRINHVLRRKILIFLARGETQRNIADIIKRSPSTVNEYVNALTSENYLEKRDNIFLLTEKGKEYANFSQMDSNRIRFHKVMVKTKISSPNKEWIKNFNNRFGKYEFSRTWKMKNSEANLFILNNQVKVRVINDSVLFTIKEVYGKDVYEATDKAEDIFEKSAKIFERDFKVSLIRPRSFKYEFCDGHYASVDNPLAKSLKKKGISLRVKDKDSKLRILMDESKGLELESVNSQKCLPDMEYMDELTLDLIENKPMFPSQMEDSLKHLTKMVYEMSKEIGTFAKLSNQNAELNLNILKMKNDELRGQKFPFNKNEKHTSYRTYIG